MHIWGAKFGKRWSLAFAAGCAVVFPILTRAEMQLELLQIQYASDKAYESQANQYSNAVPSIRSQRSFLGGALTTKADLNAILPLSDEGEFHFYSSDLYVRYKNTTPELLWAVTFGRSQRQWSVIDSTWGLGLWQPLFRWDYVNPVQMGLTGFFGEFSLPNFKVTAFASPLHLPDQQANFEINNGQMVSGSRWFRAPVSRLEIEHGTNNIYYEMKKPGTEDVIFNGVYALSLESGDLESGPWGRLSVADKPMNQFHVGVQTNQAVLLHIDSGQIHPVIHPMLVRHKLFTVETGYSWDDRNKIYLGWTQERIRDPNLPMDPNASEGWEQTELKDADYLGLGGSLSLAALNWKQTLLFAHYVQRVEYDTASATNIEGDIEASSQRLQFERMASIGIMYPMYAQRRRQVTGEMKYTHSFSDKGDWVSAQVTYAPERNLSLRLGVDVFGAPDAAGKRSFISSYRNNDRVFGGVTYVF